MISAFGVEHGVISKKDEHHGRKALTYAGGSIAAGYGSAVAGVGTMMGGAVAPSVRGAKKEQKKFKKNPAKYTAKDNSHYPSMKPRSTTRMGKELVGDIKDAKQARRWVRGGAAATVGLAEASAYGAGKAIQHGYKKVKE